MHRQLQTCHLSPTYWPLQPPPLRPPARSDAHVGQLRRRREAPDSRTAATFCGGEAVQLARGTRIACECSSCEQARHLGAPSPTRNLPGRRPPFRHESSSATGCGEFATPAPRNTGASYCELSDWSWNRARDDCRQRPQFMAREKGPTRWSVRNSGTVRLKRKVEGSILSECSLASHENGLLQLYSVQGDTAARGKCRKESGTLAVFLKRPGIFILLPAQ